MTRMTSLLIACGVAAAIYLEEYMSSGWLSRVIKTNIANKAKGNMDLLISSFSHLEIKSFSPATHSVAISVMKICSMIK